MKERLQKVLSAAGICSRRSAEAYLTGGRVTVNGKTAGLGDSADPEADLVAVDGMPLHRPERHLYLMLNKPGGYLTTLSDERGRKTVAQLVADCGARVWPVGRLDMDSEGLLILTDDGAATQRILHPSHGVEKEYLVWVTGDVLRAIPILTGPMELDGQNLYPAIVRRAGRDENGEILSIVIHEGKKRQVRRMCAAAGLKVTRLKRVREGSLILDEGLKPGKWRFLSESEIVKLLD
jgi:23S rRNA pseudouridine2605 synthase